MMDKKNRIAILYICTGEYIVFWKPFYYSFEKYFLKESTVEYFVFTDCLDLEYASNTNVHIVYEEAMEWPYPTLFRFKMFNSIEDELKNFDYCFFMNSDLICMDYIKENDFLPREKELLFTRHPSAFKRKTSDWKWETNIKSLAYINPGRELEYVAGGLNGGKTEQYLNMIKKLERNVELDLERGIIARFHDQSHIQKYASENENYIVVDEGYLYPEEYTMKFPQRFFMWEKKHIIKNVHGRKSLIKDDFFDLECKVSLYRQNYEVMRQWLFVCSKGNKLSDYFTQHSINQIAIYGYRGMGETIIEHLRDSDIEIKYIIDPFAAKIDLRDAECKEKLKDTDVIDNVMNATNIDCLVVASTSDFFNIYREYCDIVEYNILSIHNIIHELYMICL